MGKLADAVFDHHHRAIDHQPEVDCPQAEQAGCNAEPQHARKGKQHRKRNGQGNDEPRPQVAQEGEQHGDDQQTAFHQVFADRVDDVIDQFGAVVNNLYFHVRGEVLLDFLEPLAQLLGDAVAVFAHEHKAQPIDHLPLARGGDRPAADFVANLHLGHVLDADGYAVAGGDDDVGNLLQIAGTAHPVHQQHLAVLGDVPSAHVAVVFGQGLSHLLEGEGVLDELLRVEPHLELLFVPAPGVHFGHARHLLQLGLDDPVLDRAQVGELFNLLLPGQPGDVHPLKPQHVVEHFAQAGGDGAHLRPGDSLGQLDRAQAFGQQLPGEVDIYVVFEDHHHLRQPELGNRPQLLQSGKAADDLFDGEGNLPLHFLGSQGRSHRVYLDHHGGGVGKGVDVQVLKRPHPRGGGQAHHQQHQSAIA